MWCLCQVSPLQISPVGVCPLQRSPYSGDYPQHLPGVGRSIQIRAATERHTRAQLVQGPRGLAQWTQMPPTLAPCTPQMALPLCQPPPNQPSTPYQQAVQLPGKSSGRGVSLTPPWIKLPLLAAKTWRTMVDRGLGGGEMVADLPVTPGECKRRQVGRCLVRRVMSPPGQHQTFPQPQHRREPHLSQAVGQGLCPMIPHDWPPNTVVQGGKSTLSMCSRSTTSITLPPIRRQSG